MRLNVRISLIFKPTKCRAVCSGGIIPGERRVARGEEGGGRRKAKCC
jgi:hypothetical protein